MKKAFTIYDAKAECHSTPFFCDTVGLAIREMEQVVTDSKTSVSKYPEDFTLFEVGSYDPQSGRLSGREALLPLGNGIEFARNALKDEAAEWLEDHRPPEVKHNGKADSPG